MRLLVIFLLLCTSFVYSEPVGIREGYVYLSMNFGGGSSLQFTNGEVYAIDPRDQIYSSLWVTPFPVSFSESGDTEYPVTITNLQNFRTVNGRLLTVEELRVLQIPPPPPPKGQATPPPPSDDMTPIPPNPNPPPPPPAPPANRKPPLPAKPSAKPTIPQGPTK